jgi:AefR-like transcriptional repressor, C-terminal domain
METGRFPQLGQRFFELGPGRGLSILTDYLKSQIIRGSLRDGNPQVMASHFLGMIAGLPLLSRLLGAASFLEAADRRSQHLAGAVDAFVVAYSSSPGKS